jgi:hypothetical protein
MIGASMDRFLSGAALILGVAASAAAWLSVPLDVSSPLRWLIAVLTTATAAFLLARARNEDVEREAESSLPSDRSQIEAALAREIFRARRYERPFSAMLVEVVSANDRAAALEQLERETRSLIRKTDEVGFWDDGRLLLVLAESDAQNASHLMDRMRNAIEADLRFGVTEYHADDSTKSVVHRLEQWLAAPSETAPAALSSTLAMPPPAVDAGPE